MKAKAFAATLLSMGAIAAALPDPMQGYGITPMAWEVPVFPGSDETLAVNGTVEQAHAQVLKRNPNWDADFLARSTSTSSVGGSVEKRETDFGGGAYFSGARWPSANHWRVMQGVDYLSHIPGKVHLAAGPGACSRVSCSYGAAIYVCNDNNRNFELNSFIRIADGARYIAGWCVKQPGPTVAGQLFHPDNWNVIVRQDDC